MQGTDRRAVWQVGRSNQAGELIVRGLVRVLGWYGKLLRCAKLGLFLWDLLMQRVVLVGCKWLLTSASECDGTNVFRRAFYPQWRVLVCGRGIASMLGRVVEISLVILGLGLVLRGVGWTGIYSGRRKKGRIARIGRARRH